MRDGHNGESKYQYVSTQSKAIRKKKITSKVSKTLINTQKKRERKFE